jgi:hypothetical protein
MSRMMKLVEECSGTGQLMWGGRIVKQIAYQVRRYQGFSEGSGLPIPGLFRIEGSIDFDAAKDSLQWIGSDLRLKLEDGRVFGISVVDTAGRVLSEGHGPSKCLCC